VVASISTDIFEQYWYGNLARFWAGDKFGSYKCTCITWKPDNMLTNRGMPKPVIRGQFSDKQLAVNQVVDWSTRRWNCRIIGNSLYQLWHIGRAKDWRENCPVPDLSDHELVCWLIVQHHCFHCQFTSNMSTLWGVEYTMWKTWRSVRAKASHLFIFNQQWTAVLLQFTSLILQSSKSHTYCVWYFPIVSSAKSAFNRKSEMAEVCSQLCQLKDLFTSGDMCRDEL